MLTELVRALAEKQAPKLVLPQIVVLEPPQLPLPSVEEVYVEVEDDSQTSSPSTVKPPDHQIVPYLEEGKLAVSLSKTSRALAAIRRATSRVYGIASSSGNQPSIAESDLLPRSRASEGDQDIRTQTAVIPETTVPPAETDILARERASQRDRDFRHKKMFFLQCLCYPHARKQASMSTNETGTPDHREMCFLLSPPRKLARASEPRTPAEIERAADKAVLPSTSETHSRSRARASERDWDISKLAVLPSRTERLPHSQHRGERDRETRTNKTDLHDISDSLTRHPGRAERDRDISRQGHSLELVEFENSTIAVPPSEQDTLAPSKRREREDSLDQDRSYLNRDVSRSAEPKRRSSRTNRDRSVASEGSSPRISPSRSVQSFNSRETGGSRSSYRSRSPVDRIPPLA